MAAYTRTDDSLHAHFRSNKPHSSLAAPTRPMKRTASMCSLPSPPADGMVLDDDSPAAAASRSTFQSALAHGAAAGDDEDEVDQLDSDYDGDETMPKRAHRAKARPSARAACMLGSPAVLVGGGAGGASRKQLLNPFLPTAGGAPGASTSFAHPVTGAPPSPSSSPVRPSSSSHPSPSRRRHRPNPDRIRLTTPPPPSREDVEAARARAAEDERRKAMGWDDPDNVFVDKADQMARRLKESKPMQRPETLTYVKRGQRIKTSVPFTAVLTSSSPSDDPFTFTAPKLLFPPADPPSPSTARPATPPKQPSKFLEALRAAGHADKPEGAGAGAQLPPTPATLKRKAPAHPTAGTAASIFGGGAAQPQQQLGDGGRFGPYKRMRGLSGAVGGGAGAEGEQRGLR
ncbi:uncharacterized protein JCM10292_005194 [Rhodotorula paludigena]|uniref:uncharacterized protein n=1 Tax=Rhodotorula paludigena TaxID=86838 RepID=UPI00316C9BFC